MRKLTFHLFYVQEILDEITDVDLVLNLKTTRDGSMKGDLATGFYSPSREFFRMGRSRFNHSLQSQDGYLKSSRFNVEKLREYEEQVRVRVSFTILYTKWHAIHPFDWLLSFFFFLNVLLQITMILLSSE